MEKIIKKAVDGDYILLSTAYEKVEYKNKWLICTLKNDYIKSQKTERHEIAIASIFIDPLFWQALGKACGWYWTDEMLATKLAEVLPEFNSHHLWYALRFHEINLTEGWNKAVEWLEDLIK